MYKEIIITIIIVISIVVLNILTQNYTDDTVKVMQSYLEDIRGDLEDEKTIKEKLENTIEEWNSRKKILAYYLEHNEIEKIETELTALKANIETNEYNMGRENLEECYFLLEHVKEKETVKLDNIF